MRKTILGIALAVGFATGVAAQSDEGQVQGVIQSQIDAFMADDFATAFSFASPGIQRIFGTPERFGQMVKQGYPMVWRPAKVTYTALDQTSGRTLQSVLITDQRGELHLLEYEMVQTDDGWEINGVRFKRPGGFGA